MDEIYLKNKQRYFKYSKYPLALFLFNVLIFLGIVGKENIVTAPLTIILTIFILLPTGVLICISLVEAMISLNKIYVKGNVLYLISRLAIIIVGLEFVLVLPASLYIINGYLISFFFVTLTLALSSILMAKNLNIFKKQKITIFMLWILVIIAPIIIDVIVK